MIYCFFYLNIELINMLPSIFALYYVFSKNN
nr:MAG TPA: hypothetical protein [Caudoviricetes sp.]